MAIGFDLKFDEFTGDLLMEDGDFSFTTKKSELVFQRLKLVLNTFRGEWFLDRSFGVPYLQNIISKSRSKDEVDRIISGIISSDPDITRVSSYSSTFDRYDRKFEIIVTVEVDEELVTTTINIGNIEEFIYPTPNPDDPRVKCKKYEIFPYANRLYNFENFDGLPKNTYSTWYSKWLGN